MEEGGSGIGRAGMEGRGGQYEQGGLVRIRLVAKRTTSVFCRYRKVFSALLRFIEGCTTTRRFPIPSFFPSDFSSSSSFDITCINNPFFFGERGRVT